MKNGINKTIVEKVIKKIVFKIKPSSTFKTKKSKSRIPNLINSLDANELSINIGAGNTNYSSKIINLDIEKTNNVNVLADSRFLPIKSNSVSLVISQAVLEHTPETKRNIDEIERVLKPKGILYVEVPWMQTFHAHPHDYFRFSHQGIESFLENFDIYEKGIAVGPASALALNMRIFLATLFSFGNYKLFVFFGLIFSFLTFPIKFLDFFMESNPLSFYSASGIYVLAKKKT